MRCQAGNQRQGPCPNAANDYMAIAFDQKTKQPNGKKPPKRVEGYFCHDHQNTAVKQGGSIVFLPVP